ncbi:uncharacterized protein N7443_010886 [Penicillium atrosanguineum]|uniref:uncharacterized protein n=1 Tax=Penicillium atrosanguineum TaxID=1132637 RepID=UPI0023A73F9C|nr:uncharacterized protein N7443_010886 [Penicillium atrosanguineum]KAJ5290633.1 hypothetical protein N7443_010886 [Penicillium atrosanguineum]
MFQQRANEEGFLSVSNNRDFRLALPGFGRPLDFAPREQNIYGVESRSMFPSALDDRDIDYGFTDLPALTLREMEMVKTMEDITDIPQWWRKIHEPGTPAEWKKMALKSGRDITKNMANWIIEELKYKAMIYEESSAVALYNGDITKSDTNVPDDVMKELRRTAKTLEFEEEELQFYHPGSMSKQRDLLSMALYPLIYGKSRILTDRVICLDDALRYAGQGEVIPVPKESGVTREDIAWRVTARADIQVKPYSRLFQILPSDWELGDDGRWHIATYINNLHPVKCRDIYKVIEDAFNCLIPQFNMSMTPLKDMLHSRARIEYQKAEYYPVSKEVADSEPKIETKEAQSEFNERYEKWRMENYIAVQPDACQFIPWAVPKCLMSKLPEDLPSAVRIEQPVNLNEDYKERGLQVITRLIGLDLTPEDPFYQTDWHVEGQMNEHICAAAFVHFDADNMKDASMEFRNIVDRGTLEEVEHEPNDFIWLKQVFGLENGEPAIQHVGSVKCPVGRTVIFPSIVQHRYTGFELLDPTKTGHLRVLVFYLVDPNIRIISTANVPPQRLDWTLDIKDDGGNLTATMAKLALDNKNEKGNMPMSLSEAQEYRVEALEELVEFMRYQHVAFESNILML